MDPRNTLRRLFSPRSPEERAPRSAPPRGPDAASDAFRAWTSAHPTSGDTHYQSAQSPGPRSHRQPAMEVEIGTARLDGAPSGEWDIDMGEPRFDGPMEVEIGPARMEPDEDDWDVSIGAPRFGR